MDDKQDFVSNLPDEILKHIISFLPLQEAIRITTLSTLFKQIFSPISLSPHKLSIHESLTKFLSSYICHDTLKISLNEEVIVFAIKGVHKELHLDFAENNITTKDNISFNLSLRITQSLGLFSSLKTLNLRSLNLHGTSFVSHVFASCDCLESLKIEKCIGLKKVRVFAGNSLRSLIVFDCHDIVKISVFAPNLMSFKYRGILPRLKLKNAFELREATLDLSPNDDFDCEEVLKLLFCFKEAHCLTISGWFIEWLCKAGVIFEWLEFGFDKLKELKWMSPTMDRSKRDSLACFLNACPLLEKLFIQIDESVGSEKESPYFYEYWHEPHLWNGFEAVKSNTLEMKHLNMLKWSGFRGLEDEILLIELLLNKALLLQSMIII